MSLEKVVRYRKGDSCPCGFSMNIAMKEVKMRLGRRGDKFSDDGRE